MVTGTAFEIDGGRDIEYQLWTMGRSTGYRPVHPERATTLSSSAGTNPVILS